MRLGLAERSFEIADIHAGEDLPRFHGVALIRQDRCDAAGELRLNIDLVGLGTPIAVSETGRQPGLME